MTAAELLARLENRPKEKTAYELPTIEEWERYKVNRIRYDRALLLDAWDGVLEIVEDMKASDQMDDAIYTALEMDRMKEQMQAMFVIVTELRSNP